MGKRVRFKQRKNSEKVEFTIREALDAIEKDGLEKTQGGWWADTRPAGRGVYDVGAGCALGQGAINMGIDWASFTDILRTTKYKGHTLSDAIMGKNDSRGWDLARIAQYYREKYADRLDIKLSGLANKLYDIEWLDDDASAG